jgi:hypothetical protein
MLQTIAILKKPTEMQMALSTQVKESVQLATKHLRDALAFASRSEHSMTVSTLADLLVRCESLECMDEMMNKFAGPSKTTGNMPSQRGDDPSSDEDRLQDYFWKLEKLIPNPYRDWGKCVRPCKWQRIIKERQKKDPDGAG